MRPSAWRFALPALLVFLAVPPTSAQEDKTRIAAIGDQAPNTNSLRDVRGNRRPLHDFKDKKAVVLFFAGAECPVSNLYLPEVIALEKKYRDKGAQFLSVYSSENEDLDQVAGHAYDRDTPFPVLKDSGQRLAAALRVTRVPTVVVLDGEFTIRYRGRVDDRYGSSARRPKASRDDLALALDEVLEGKRVSVAETEVDGCLLDRKPAEGKKGVTFAKDVPRSCRSTARPATGPSRPRPSRCSPTTTRSGTRG